VTKGGYGRSQLLIKARTASFIFIYSRKCVYYATEFLHREFKVASVISTQNK